MPKSPPTPGAHLHKLMPNEHISAAVTASARHAERHGNEKADSNAENRLNAHLGRLDKLMGRGEHVETRVWDAAINELIIKPGDIPESYWQQQIAIARDNGHGDIEIDSHLKSKIVEQLQDAQKTGAESWATYLQATGDQYPTWFKYYAWDGMSKLGVFDKSKGQYRKRRRGTVAPYPQLNPAALAKVYSAVSSKFDGRESTDVAIAQLVQIGNFNKLYSHFLLNQKAIIPTPENPEDVRVEWRKYTADDIESIVAAAEGTPWCIAGEKTAIDYTNDGSEFYLFHLQDKETGAFSSTAAASIRMEDGEVAEISGLKGGKDQYVEDALMPTVQAKVAELPGGERYMKAFAHKEKLIEMDRKFQAGDAFTLDELRFLYELDEPIEYIDTYTDDPRPSEFKKNLDIHREQLREVYGADAEWMVMESQEIAKNLTKLLEAGASIDLIVEKLEAYYIAYNLTKLLEAGATINIDSLIENLSSNEIADNLTQLLEAGATINIDSLVSKLTPYAIATNLTQLLEYGATINIDSIVDRLGPSETARRITELLNAGATIDVDELVGKLDFSVREFNVSSLLDAGAYADAIVEKLNPDDIARYITQLLEGGADANAIVEKLDANHLDRFSSQLLEAGADANALVENLGELTIAENITMLINAGANPDQIIRRITSDVVYKNLVELLRAGATAEALSGVLGYAEFDRHIVEFLENGSNPDFIVKNTDNYHIDRYLTPLLEAGANVDIIVNVFHPAYISRNLTELLEAGASRSLIEQKLGRSIELV